MGYSKEVRSAAVQKIKGRKLAAERLAENNKTKIHREIPEAERIDREISSCSVNAARAVLKGGNVKQELEALMGKSLFLQEEYDNILRKRGYSPQDTIPQYTCTKCNDTGYIELDNRTVMCSCLKQALVEAACAELNRHSPLSLCTFEDFSLEYYPSNVDEGYPRSSREQMGNILNYCKKYAECFTENSESIFMKGKTGLGKTHLSLSIANEVIRKGYGVIYVSAPSIVSTLEKEHFSYNKENAATEDALLSCDLLIIDDLGTEFSTQFSTSAIYNIFNSRLLANKPVIINTNLTIQELEKAYSQRFVSRISGHAKRLDFFGRDIRTTKSKG